MIAECATCSEPATCVGRYEDEKLYAYACDACCGHGCEDGKCYPLEEVPDLLDGLYASSLETNELRARVAALESQVFMLGGNPGEGGVSVH